MNTYWLFLLPIVYGVSREAPREAPKQAPCPNPDRIHPCTCQYDEDTNVVNVDCSDATTSSEIFAAFNDVSWPFNRLTEFKLYDNTAVEELPDGVFGEVSFERMYLEDCAVVTVHPTALLSSNESLYDLGIFSCPLEEFPFHVLPQLNRLELLMIDTTSIGPDVPPIQSETLQSIVLTRNQISRLNETGWSTPNLRQLSLASNPFSEFPSELLKRFTNLEEFSCEGCRLGPSLSSGLLEFNSEAMWLLWLDYNNINHLDVGAIAGISPNTIIALVDNDIVDLTEESFRPIMEVLSRGSGFLVVDHNPIECGCSMAWLVLNEDLWRSVSGTCDDGKDIQDLDPHFFQDFCKGHFKLCNNTSVLELPEGVFGEVTFEVIEVCDCAVVALHPSAIVPSADTLEYLTVRACPFEDFPFHVLPELIRLKNLFVVGTRIGPVVPPLQSMSLEDLHVGFNLISALNETGWSTPNLKALRLNANHLLETPLGILEGLKNLEEFHCHSCSLGPDLSYGFLKFHSQALSSVILYNNNIVHLEMAAITGLTPNTILNLTINSIVELTEESFRPMVEVLSDGNGLLILEDNPIECGCSMAWLVLNEDLRRSVSGHCDDGTDIQDLDPLFFEELCEESYGQGGSSGGNFPAPKSLERTEEARMRKL
ncbi:unnamed protein product [Darwinula stevensoni]|uniref:Oplophorus-luciferin 2-monooxygenase non-catalytic subunit n=1 Tax=Darwinula stevensoni TaxID=69355 RepID=A0A7R9AC71_9CRUS|nr:unnamed protein product [Darwinula stevensoni]CAG0900104.1 unnamed protein product [Darwinula stevensoni]